MPSEETVVTHIHPTAVVAPGAEIGLDVEIGPHSVVGPSVVVGNRTRIGPQVVLDGRTRIGEDNLIKAIDLYEKSHIERTLGKTAGDKIRAAELLGLSLSTLYRKIEKLGIEA